jgi:hypothetical protein
MKGIMQATTDARLGFDRTVETAASPQAWQWKGAGVSRNMVCCSGTPLGAPA